MTFRTKIWQNFSQYAGRLSEAFTAFVGNPDLHSCAPNTYQVWDFWNVPDLYCYLRTSPDRVFGTALIGEFMTELRNLVQAETGLTTISHPWLHVYVNGMGQEIHNDSANGVYAYVFSLTPNDRHFTGGQTCVAREGVFDKLEPRVPNAGPYFFEIIEPNFNQLVLFDDRLPHCVRHVCGGMDLARGRVVLTGHIS